MMYSGWIPVLVLVATLLVIRLSGNDKAPFLLPLPLVVSVVILIMLGRTASWHSRMLALCPWLYVIAAVVLARAGLVDSALTLGFR